MMKNYNFSSVVRSFASRGLQAMCFSLMLLWSTTSFGQAGAYSFAESTSTWTEITGTASTAAGDDGTQVLPLPIPFSYNGVPVTDVTIGTNGFLRLFGGAMFSTDWTNELANTARTPVVAGLWDDHHLVAGTGTIVYTTTGTAPNRVFTVQWKDVTTSGTGSNTATTKASFQIRLSEGTNGIQIIYGPSDLGTFSASIGLNSAPGGTGNFLSVTPGSPATTSSTTANNAIATAPASGTTYSFLPPAASTVTAIASGLWSNTATWSTGNLPNFASTVVISGGNRVEFDVPSATVASLTVGNGTTNDSLRFSAAVARTLVVNGNLTTLANGVFTTVPTTGTAARNIFVSGNYVNNGVSDLSTNATLIVFNGTGQSVGGTGTFSNGSTIREIQADNGLTVSSPINVSARFTLVNGVLNSNGNLTMDNTLGGVVTGGVTFRRSVVTPPIVGAINVGATAVYNLDYVFFTGQVTPVVCTTGTEIPASRTINGIRLAGNTGTQLVIAGGNLTLTSASNSTTVTFPNTATAPGALVFSSGIFVVPSGSEMILSNGALTNITGGSATAYINGKLTWTVSSTTAQTRNFSVGNGVDRMLVVLAGLNTAGSSQTFSVELTGAPSGTGVSPVSGIIGSRGARITSNASLGATATVQLNWTAADALSTGNISQLRIVQAASLSGPWTERSVASGTGVITATGNRTTAAGVDLANGEFFAFGTTSPGEVVVAAITEPFNKGCFTATETVKAVIRNNGTAFDRSASNIVVKGTLTSPSGTITTLAAVTRNSGTFASLTNDTITFTTPVNLVDTGNYIVRVFIDTIAGQFAAGDTLNRTIRSAVYTATANPALILTTQSSTLRVNTNDVGIFSPNSSLVRISEVVAFRAGVGAQATYPAYVPAAAQDFIELTNFGDTAQSIAGWGIEIFNTGARTYTFPAGTVIPANSVLVLHVGPGTDDPANRYYNTGGANDGISSTSAWGVTLKNVAGSLIDAVAIRAFTFGAATGVTAADWSGTTVSTSSAGVMLIRFDNNNASNWQNSIAAGPLTNIGALNPDMTYAPATVSWVGPGGFTASGMTVSTGARNTPGTETFTATITSNGCAKTASASLQVVAPVVPVAGFTASDDTTTTGGVLGTIILTDTSLNVPFNRKWTITPNTVQFVNNTNDSGAVAQVQFLAAGSYAIKLRVSNPAGADSVTRQNAVLAQFVYCPSFATNTGDTKIDSVMLGTAMTGSTETTCQTYTNYDSLGVVANITKSFGYPISIKNGWCGTTGYVARGRVFIDLNKDGSFTPNEGVFDFGPTLASPATLREWWTGNLMVPANADTGITRLRIVFRESAATANDVLGCGTYGYGETEDYTVRIVAPALTNFALVGPADSTFLNVDGQSTIPVSVNWQRSIPAAGSVTYAWQLAARAAGNFNAPLATLASNNSGADTALTLNFGAIDQLMASLGVNVGDTVRGIWRIRAVRGTDTLYSLNPRSIDLRRGTVVFNCPITALPTNIVGDTICGSGSATLSAAAPGSQEVVWYNANNTIGALGTSITTGTISANSTFQVGLANSQNGNQAFGPASPTTGTFPAANFTNGMYYTVLAPIRIDSITFFTNGPRAGAVQVWDKNPAEDPTAVILQVAPWNITATGVSRVPVSIYLTPGRYYMNNTYGAGTGVLFRTTGGATFPYVLAGKISLDSSWLGAGSNLLRLYYFFDMRISDACFGPTAPATVTVTPAPVATLPYAANLEGAGIPCNFINSGAWQSGTAAGLSGAGFTIPAPAAGTGIAAARTAGRLISPSFDFSTVTSVSNLNLTFLAFNNGTLGSKAYVEVSLDSGVTFIRVDSVAAGAAWQTKTVNLAAYAGRPSVHFAFNHAITGGNGSGFAIDNIALNSSCGAAQVVVNIRTDIYGSEITWTLRDSITNNLIATGGPYPDVTPYNAAAATHIDTFCVPNNARLLFRINDSYGDGLWDGTNAGTYNVSLICPTGLVTLFAGADSLPYGSVANPPQYDSAFVTTTCFIPDTMSVFNLLTPANNTAVQIQGSGSQTVNFTWQPSARSVGTTPVTYTWSLETATANPVTLTSRSGLTSPSLNIDYGVLADTLTARGLNVGGTFSGRWKVVASSGTLTRDAVARFNISLTRGVITSVDENELGRAMSLYPNPAENQATLSYNFDKNVDLKVVLVNPVGQEVLSINENNALRGEVMLDISSLQSGMYFVRISDGNRSTVKRLMIQR